MTDIELERLDRDEIIRNLKSTDYDVLVIGGGITGAGIALDAASRGFSVALVEMNDFASGTSSRSTKLIHGGLRYLKQFEIALVREVGRERAIVHKLAPHLVRSEKMLLPLIQGGTFGKFATSLGLMVYDVLAGVESADQRKMLSKEETLLKEPLLDPEVLEGSGIYAEYRTDDARLTVEVIKTACAFGADCINYVQVLDFTYDEGTINGAHVRDVASGDLFDISARYVISAAGPWVDELRDKDDSLEGKRLHLTKGVHIVIPHDKLPVRQAVYFDVPDGRMIFAIPRGQVTYVGTTDTDYSGDKNHVLTNLEDVEYLLDAVNNTFPSVHLTSADVVSSWAGLRPLIHEDGKSASELSRKDEIFESETGLLSMAGGKLTGYRKMGERIVNILVKKFEEDHEDAGLADVQTDHIPLGGAAFKNAEEVNIYQRRVGDAILPFGLGEYDAWYLTSNYGKQTDTIIENLKSANSKGLHALLEAEVRYCMEFELTHTLCDFFIRRTGRLYFDIGSVRQGYEWVAEVMAKNLNWDDDRLNEEIQEIRRNIEEVSNFT
ncbi:glycerol-3-phosphate dehydrogenase/oxidase [Fulvivirga sedimenti]|uniref:Glycerol-3-phosphate dehydrogenase n=1 Tax=Fulvivirga sedimenti TaxID=2879465 RepID=A0A9X1L1Z0_9BACT|nr:glycerol-3-phosphate dehydrogenase/oxidase [Fulvivirga sedimenti]MCA6079174.1 glycerol-3-phosphate dehydrogenase/oxidase [Fulvivirga sedimenti]